MKLTDFVVKDAIVPQLQSASKEDVIREMVASLKNSGAVASEEEEAMLNYMVRASEGGNDESSVGRTEGTEDADLDVGFLLEDFQADLRNIQENIRTGNFMSP